MSALPPGMPIQSMPQGWLKQITLSRERIDKLEKTVLELTKRITEMEKLTAPRPELGHIGWVRGHDGSVYQEAVREAIEQPVKRGPGRPRKVSPA